MSRTDAVPIKENLALNCPSWGKYREQEGITPAHLGEQCWDDYRVRTFVRVPFLICSLMKVNLNQGKKYFTLHIPSSATLTAFWFPIPNCCSVVILFSQMPNRTSLTHSSALRDGGQGGGVSGRPYIRLCIAFNLACLVWVTFETHNWKRMPQSRHEIAGW